MGSEEEQRMTGNDSRNESLRDTTSAAETGAETQLEFSSNEDWKNRVKAEDAAFDEKFGPDETASVQTNSTGDQAATPDRSAERGTEPQFPEPSFAGLLGMLSTQAMVALGIIPNPVTQKADRQLPLARYFIDLIAVLEQKTSGNLDVDEAAAVEESLHTLRMAFVQRSKEKA
jgi:hypothetical protein